MDRLTMRISGAAAMAREHEEMHTFPEWIDMLHERLAAYEDTGLTPEEITGVLTKQQEQRWIPVTERLPEPGVRVLATDGGFVGEFYINKRGQWQRYNVNNHALRMALDILWWLAMPEPPKMEG